METENKKRLRASNSKQKGISKEIHKNLSKCVNLFSYWTVNINKFIDYHQQLDKLDKFKQQIKKNEDERKQTRESTKKQTMVSQKKILEDKIKKFNEGYKKQSLVLKRFFEACKKEKNTSSDLCAKDIISMPDETINRIIEDITKELVKTRNNTKRRKNTTSHKSTSRVTQETFTNNICILQSAIKLQKKKELEDKIKKFNEGYKKQSLVVKRFFEACKKEKNTSSDLCINDIISMTDETISRIIEDIENDLVKTENSTKRKKNTRSPKSTSLVSPVTLRNNIFKLQLAIKSYQLAVESDEGLAKIKKSVEEETKKLHDQLEHIKTYQDFNLEFNNDDSTNFVAAEMGFLIEVQDEYEDKPRIEYCHYPVTFTNKNTLNIYDLFNDEFNFSFKNKKICHCNHILDDFIAATGTRRKANQRNDYHSESVLFFLCQQRSFQEKMISNLIKDLQKKNLKVIKLEKLILEIHSTNNMCDHCFEKAKYFTDLQENIGNQGKHFFDDFRQALTNMLRKNNVLHENVKLSERTSSFTKKLDLKVLDLEVNIKFTYHEDYENASIKKHPRIIRSKIKANNLHESDSRVLSKYSIITSGGAGNVHRTYSYAYNKAVEPARIHAETVIARSWRRFWIRLCINRKNLAVKIRDCLSKELSS